MAEWHLLRKPDGSLAGVGSSDRTHDVDLYVDGDFEDDNQMRKYCEWLRDTLNHSPLTTAHTDEGKQ